MYFKGFSNNECEYSIHGCCPDGVTPAEGANLENCAEKNNDQNSNYEDETEEGSLDSNSVRVNNSSANNDNRSSGGTEGRADEELNCVKSEFGCCDDGYTPANSPDKENCPDYVIDINDPVEGGSETSDSTSQNDDTAINEANSNIDKTIACSLSKYECCPDGVTHAEGPGFKGCSEENYVSKSRFAQLNDRNLFYKEKSKIQNKISHGFSVL